MRRHISFAWEMVLLILTFLSLSLLVVVVTNPSYVYNGLLFQIDFIISLVFLVDFIIKMLITSNKRLFWKEYWIQLLASLPAVSAPIQALQFLRFLRLVKFVKVFHAHKRLVHEGDKRYDGETFQTFNIIVVVVTMMFASSLIFFDAEFGINPKVHTFFDAIWWSFVTITTTGYGDVYPITTVGRLAAMFLMFFGIGTFMAVVANFNQKLFRREERHLKPNQSE